MLEAALEPALPERAHPVRTVATYGRRPPARAAESAFDRDMLEELKASATSTEARIIREPA